MRRLLLQAEAGYSFTPGRRFELGLGAYLGWQLTMITREAVIRENEKEHRSTILNGDAEGFRAGLSGEVRLKIARGLWASINAAWGVDLVHQQDDNGEEKAEAFLRPQVFGQLGYTF